MIYQIKLQNKKVIQNFIYSFNDVAPHPLQP